MKNIHQSIIRNYITKMIQHFIELNDNLYFIQFDKAKLLKNLTSLQMTKSISYYL